MADIYTLSFFKMDDVQIVGDIEFTAEDDFEAIRYAERQFVAVPKELWSGERLVRRFFAKLGKFIAHPIPEDEERRLTILPSYDLLGTDPEPEFDQLVRFTANLLHAPIGMISLIGERDQWFKARWGLDVASTPREVAFCAHTILSDEQLVVPDASEDVRFRDNPLVTGDPHIRFYAGSPIIGEDGIRLGSLCVIDRAPRFDFNDDQRGILRELAAIVSERFKLRRLQRALLAVEREAFRDAELGRIELAAQNNELLLLRTKVKTIIVEIDRIAVGMSHLAINAAIEAANAGSTANGFGAVVTEIKKLAADTRHATTIAGELLSV